MGVGRVGVGRRRQGSHMGDLETSSQRSGKKLLQVQDSRAAPVSCSAVSGEGRGPRKQPREQRWGPEGEALQAHQQKECPPHPSDEHNSEPQMGEVMGGGGKYMAARSEGSLSSAGKAVSQRRPVDAWVVEGTEVLISTVPFFGKVSADGAVRFVFHNLGLILQGAGLLDKQPAFEPSRTSLFFVKASPGGTTLLWPRKRRLSTDPPPATTIGVRPGAYASPHWASAPGRRWETQQWWNHQFP